MPTMRHGGAGRLPARIWRRRRIHLVHLRRVDAVDAQPVAAGREGRHRPPRRGRCIPAGAAASDAGRHDDADGGTRPGGNWLASSRPRDGRRAPPRCQTRPAMTRSGVQRARSTWRGAVARGRVPRNALRARPPSAPGVLAELVATKQHGQQVPDFENAAADGRSASRRTYAKFVPPSMRGRSRRCAMPESRPAGRGPSRPRPRRVAISRRDVAVALHFATSRWRKTPRAAGRT